MSTKASNISEIQRIVALSNQVAEYPPIGLNKLQYQALLILVSCIDSTERPIYGIEDIRGEIEQRGITDKMEQIQFLEHFINKQNTYRIPFKEYVKYFTDGKTPRGGVIKRALDAAISLNNRPIKFNNPEYEGSFAWFQAVARDKKTDDLVFVITSFSKPFLLGLKRDFLQMLAESTMDFDGKYSVPIFLYMKSKLYHGRKEFHGWEPVETFRKRFGLDTSKTYDRFFDLQRRILDVASKDSKKSRDIFFEFRGEPGAGSKKITKLYYDIYRIGNIHGLKTAKGSKSSSIHQEKLALLTESQIKAYEFLAEKQINKAFILDRILTHPKVQYELLRGYEDVYVNLLWKQFLKYTKSKEKAAAFVTWWKNGRLTMDSRHAAILERVHKAVNAMSEEERELRRLAKGMTHQEYKHYREGLLQTAANGNISVSKVMRRRPGKLRRPFDLEKFKQDYPEQFAAIRAQKTNEYTLLFPAGKQKTLQFNKALQNAIAGACEHWFNQQQ